MEKSHEETKGTVEEMQPVLALSHSNSLMAMEHTTALRESHAAMDEQLREVQQQMENQGGEKMDELEQAIETLQQDTCHGLHALQA